MTRSLTSPALLLFALILAPAQGNANSPCKGFGPVPPGVMERGDYDWRKVTPLEHLSYLKTRKDSYTVWGCEEGWVKESDIPALMALLDSRERCVSQHSSVSAFIGPRKSTVGNEAAWLIEAFRVGRFPPNNASASTPETPELRKWWAERFVRQPKQPFHNPAE
jgi:hypothetical protein